MKDKNNKDEWKGFDDCAICQAMKNGKANNMEDLMKAFQRAEKMNGDKLPRVGISTSLTT